MLNNFIYAKLKSLFEEKLAANEVPQEAIVFIEDTKEIWNHGTYFATPSGSSISAEDIENIVASSETIQAVMEQIAGEVIADSGKQDIIEDLDTIRSGASLGSTAIQPGTGDGAKFLSDDGEYKEIVVPTKVSELENDLSIATTTTSGLMSAEDKAKLDQVTATNTSIVTQAEYDALVSAGAATSGTVYYIRG
jgi:hypothetical protein